MAVFQDKKMNKEIFSLALPAIFEMLLHTLVWTFDTGMVGRLTPEAISSVTLGAQIMFTVSNILGALGVGTTAMVSRNIGAMNSERAENIAVQALSLGIIISLVVGSIGIILSDNIFHGLVDDPKVMELGTEYLRIVFIGAFFLIPTMIGNSILRGAGNTYVPMISAGMANIFNIVGDYVLIFGKLGFPRMETKGAAIATAFGQIVGAIITFYYLFKTNNYIRVKVKGLFKFNREILNSLVNLSFPAILEVFMNEGSRLVSSFWIAQLGTLSYASNSITVAAESISFMPGYGFAIAATTLVGQNLGSKDVEKAEKSVNASIYYAILLMGIVGILFFAIPYPIMRLFSSDKETVFLASKCLRIGAFEQIPTAIGMTLSGALKGAGDTKGPFRISLVTNFLVRLPLIFLIVFVFKLPIIYIWVATNIQYLVEATLMTIKYKKGAWKNILID
ncbi:MATE family efflux transporter [Anaerosalibacter massiliensis]|uniref:MATE family efflux transporter n=1 Tax=Anaerosalibacter massiliensis TaxID=1347392 RepID=UPI0005B2700D|nr:MATE family efflux transporter [Anaerosalibacter massiliensis]